jgi:hypothetical protein
VRTAYRRGALECSIPGERHNRHCFAMSWFWSGNKKRREGSAKAVSTFEFRLNLFNLWAHWSAPLPCRKVQDEVHYSAGWGALECGIQMVNPALECRKSYKVHSTAPSKSKGDKKMSSPEKQSLTALVWQHAPSRYSGTELVVLLRLAGLSERDGHAWPLIDTLAAMCGIKPRRLSYVLARLEEEGFLKRQRRYGHSNRYFLDVDEIRRLPSVVPAKPEVPAPAATPESSAPAPVAEDGRSIAQSLASALRAENPASPSIPLDLTHWSEQFQSLLDSGHDVKTIKSVTRFGRKHQFWEIDVNTGDVVDVVVKNFPQMLMAYSKSLERKERAA